MSALLVNTLGANLLSERPARPGTLRTVQVPAEHARARGVTRGPLAVARVLNNAVITGLRTEAQWADYMGRWNAEYRFTPGERRVSGERGADHPFVSGHNDPAYSLEGRVPQTAPA